MPHTQQIQAWHKFFFPYLETSVEISWLLVERWDGKDLGTQGESRSSSVDPELAEMLEAKQKSGFSLQYLKGT